MSRDFGRSSLRKSRAGTPLAPRGDAAIAVAGAVSLLAHFLVGAAKSLFTLRSWWAAGLEMTLAGVIVGGATYAVGLAFA